MLVVDSLKVAYGESEVIHGLSLEAKEGETIAVMGRNGMGKTTLMKSLIGVLPSKSGSIKLNDNELTGLESYKRVKSGIAYVPQGRQVFSTLTVEDNIKTGLETVADKNRISDNIYAIFPVLHEMRYRKAGNLSGGQQQQLAIARALVSEPKVLLLDEPTEGIQPSIIKEMAVMLNEIKKIYKLAIIVSEQVLSFTLDIADRFLVIDSGQFVHEDHRAEVDADKISSYLAV